MLGKSALALLTEYGGDSSDEEVPGPRVSTKRTFRDDDSTYLPRKSQKLLPLPNTFIPNEDVDDHLNDPSLHSGRIRSFAHERGNWATFVYIPFEAQIGIDKLLSNITEIIPNHIEIHKCDDFHISLTKTVILKYHWINPFVESLRNSIASFTKFLILFDSIKIYCNEERSRTFLGIQIKSGYDTLLKIVKELDRCLEEFHLPPFYSDPSFHMSIAWCLGDKEQELQHYLPQMNKQLQFLMETYEQQNWYIYVQNLYCKSGNKYYQFTMS